MATANANKYIFTGRNGIYTLNQNLECKYDTFLKGSKVYVQFRYDYIIVEDENTTATFPFSAEHFRDIGMKEEGIKANFEYLFTFDKEGTEEYYATACSMKKKQKKNEAKIFMGMFIVVSALFIALIGTGITVANKLCDNGFIRLAVPVIILSLGSAGAFFIYSLRTSLPDRITQYSIKGDKKIESVRRSFLS